jgi:hypothetical protein
MAHSPASVVARRWLLGNLFLPVEHPFAETFRKYKAEYEVAFRYLTKWYANFGKPIETVLKDEYPPADMAAFHVYIAGRSLCESIKTTKEIPKAKLRAFEKAIKVFNYTRRPSQMNVWFVKNLALVQMLLESEHWPDRGSSEERSYTVGPFQVVNHTTQPVEASTKLLQTALDLMKRSGIPSISRVLYGEVFLVGDIERKKSTMATYNATRDTIELLLMPRFSAKFLQSLVHEFGHRYWHLHLAPKSEWNEHHRSLTRGDLGVHLPEVGDVIEFVKGHPKVVGFAPFNGKLQINLDTGGMISTNTYFEWASKHKERAKFPTIYSARDPEEHFCEAFSLYCLGDLKEPHKSAFEALVVNNAAGKVAQRWLAKGNVLS